MSDKIILNAVRCRKCDAVLISTYRHDYKTCKCGVMVDGGKDYLRRGWPEGNPDDWYEELSEYAHD